MTTTLSDAAAAATSADPCANLTDDEWVAQFLFPGYKNHGAVAMNRSVNAGCCRERFERLTQSHYASYLLLIMEWKGVNLEGLQKDAQTADWATLVGPGGVPTHSFTAYLGLGHDATNTNIKSKVWNACATKKVSGYQPPGCPAAASSSFFASFASAATGGTANPSSAESGTATKSVKALSPKKTQPRLSPKKFTPNRSISRSMRRTTSAQLSSRKRAQSVEAKRLWGAGSDTDEDIEGEEVQGVGKNEKYDSDDDSFFEDIPFSATYTGAEGELTTTFGDFSMTSSLPSSVGGSDSKMNSTEILDGITLPDKALNFIDDERAVRFIYETTRFGSRHCSDEILKSKTKDSFIELKKTIAKQEAIRDVEIAKVEQAGTNATKEHDGVDATLTLKIEERRTESVATMNELARIRDKRIEAARFDYEQGKQKEETRLEYFEATAKSNAKRYKDECLSVASAKDAEATRLKQAKADELAEVKAKRRAIDFGHDMMDNLVDSVDSKYDKHEQLGLAEKASSKYHALVDVFQPAIAQGNYQKVVDYNEEEDMDTI